MVKIAVSPTHGMTCCGECGNEFFDQCVGTAIEKKSTAIGKKSSNVALRMYHPCGTWCIRNTKARQHATNKCLAFGGHILLGLYLTGGQ